MSAQKSCLYSKLLQFCEDLVAARFLSVDMKIKRFGQRKEKDAHHRFGVNRVVAAGDVHMCVVDLFGDVNKISYFVNRIKQYSGLYRNSPLLPFDSVFPVMLLCYPSKVY